MKFFFFRKSPEAVIQDLQTGLERLNFAENFQGFEWTGTIAASSEVSIVNAMRDGTIPSGFIITDAVGVNSIVRGAQEWTARKVSLKNFNATDSATVTVFFFR